MKEIFSNTPNIIFGDESVPSESEHFPVKQNVSIYFAAMAFQKLVEYFWRTIFRYSWNWTVAFIVAYVLIFVIGMIGNCMVILVIILRPRMRLATNMFIMNLAVADLFFIVFCVCPTLLENTFQRESKIWFYFVFKNKTM